MRAEGRDGGMGNRARDVEPFRERRKRAGRLKTRIKRRPRRSVDRIRGGGGRDGMAGGKFRLRGRRKNSDFGRSEKPGSIPSIGWGGPPRIWLGASRGAQSIAFASFQRRVPGSSGPGPRGGFLENTTVGRGGTSRAAVRSAGAGSGTSWGTADSGNFGGAVPGAASFVAKRQRHRRGGPRQVQISVCTGPRLRAGYRRGGRCWPRRGPRRPGVQLPASYLPGEWGVIVVFSIDWAGYAASGPRAAARASSGDQVRPFRSLGLERTGEGCRRLDAANFPGRIGIGPESCGTELIYVETPMRLSQFPAGKRGFLAWTPYRTLGGARAAGRRGRDAVLRVDGTWGARPPPAT